AGRAPKVALERRGAHSEGGGSPQRLGSGEALPREEERREGGAEEGRAHEPHGDSRAPGDRQDRGGDARDQGSGPDRESCAGASSGRGEARREHEERGGDDGGETQLNGRGRVQREEVREQRP